MITRLVKKRAAVSLKIQSCQNRKGGFKLIQVLTSRHRHFLLCNIKDINGSFITDKARC